ncbi:MULTISPECIES: hypothetical protein [Mesorhizobium]|uniref:Uncharacterized protein n=1 Tax=Mesorhizobium denitrificans TaxID=2294114 RepID=A0A371XG05_9HYPH|nr:MULTISPECIES: hypothetical protein [Mesorhizobium]RFC68158.1 hypothetical protein DY251_07740 [Mesorhizobium denitrificans]
MSILKLSAVALSGSVAAFNVASAEECSAYDKEVAEVAQTIRSFQSDEDFKTYGFGLGGPFNKWTVKAQKLASREEARTFVGTYGFTPDLTADIALAYRSGKPLNVLLAKVETEISAFLDKCA